MGIKERRTKILLAIFLLSDVNFSYVPLNDFVEKSFDIYLNQKTRATLSALLKDNLIEKETLPAGATSPEGLVYKLTRAGFAELCLTFPFFRYLVDGWDGRWRILSYEIPEKKRELRDRLRREVAGWGLGPWHRSFWLTPHPVTEALKNLIHGKEEEKYVQAFESEHVFGDKETLIEKVWAKSKLEVRYRELFRVWHETLSTELDKANKFRKVVTEYVTILKDDPGLPRELVGETWIGFEAFTIFKEIRSILLA